MDEHFKFTSLFLEIVGYEDMVKPTYGQSEKIRNTARKLIMKTENYADGNNPTLLQ